MVEQNLNRFIDKTVVVTGAGHGIGRASALRFASEGAKVAVVDIRTDHAEEVAEECRKIGADAMAVTTDVSDAEHVAALGEQVTTAWGTPDVLHNNAGILIAGTVLDQTIDDWDRTFAVNVRSTFLVTRAFLGGMVERGSGAIVCTSSTSGFIGDPGLTAYDSSKAAVMQFVRQLAADYAGRGIRPNSVIPGLVGTGFNDPWFEVNEGIVESDLAETLPTRRQGTPEEIAAAVAFLASDDARYIVGHALVVDGGFSVVG